MFTTGYHETVNYKCLLGLQHETSDLFLKYCGIEYCTPDHKFGHKLREEHLIHIVFQGGGTFSFKGKHYSLREQQAFYIPPDTSDYHYQPDSNDPWAYAWIGFDGSKSLQYLEQTGLSINSPVCSLQFETPVLISLFQGIFDAKSLTRFNELVRVGYLYRIMSLLIRCKLESSSEKNAFQYSPNAYARYTKQLIESDFSNNSISDIVKKVGVDRSYLSYIFKQNYRLSPQEYLIQCRLQKAKELLLDTNLSINEIAFSVGYKDVYGFLKLFKKRCNITPTEYRQLKQENSYEEHTNPIP